MSARTGFESDNQAPAHPAILEALVRANVGHAPSYGEDEWTARAEERFRAHFGSRTRAFPVFNGTAANVLALAAVTRAHQAILCARAAHVDVDECGAPERFTGCKLIALDTIDGKIAPAAILAELHGRGDQHRVQPRVVTISNTTELGTLYRPHELRALVEVAHEHELLVHVDGARLCNAAAAQGLGLAALTSEVGVDLVSFGGTKNGLLGAEAVLLLRPELAPDFAWVRKQGLQLASKQRFLAAQLARLLEDDLWLANARHANAMATELARRLEAIPGFAPSRPVEANAVFARLPRAAIEWLQRRWRFHIWSESSLEVRWMCAWDTRPEDVEEFSDDVRRALQAAPDTRTRR